MFSPKIQPDYVRVLPPAPSMANAIEYAAKVATAKDSMSDIAAAEQFVRKMGRLGHESVMEHARIQVDIDLEETPCTTTEPRDADWYYAMLLKGMNTPGARYIEKQYTKCDTSDGGTYAKLSLQGNLHAWRDLFRDWQQMLLHLRTGDGPLGRFAASQRVWTYLPFQTLAYTIMYMWYNDLSSESLGYAIEDLGPIPSLFDNNEWLHATVRPMIRITYLPLGEGYHSVEVGTSRSIADELVRHRVAVTMESTRYRSYNTETLQVSNSGSWFGWAQPSWRNHCKRLVWAASIRFAQLAYLTLRKLGCKAENARGVLPMDTATRLIITATDREWRKILSLRLAPAAHPQIRYLAELIKDALPQYIANSLGD